MKCRLAPPASPYPDTSRPVVVAVEGLCFAGKTTLATALAERLGAAVIPEYAELMTLPPFPPRDHIDVADALCRFLAVERDRALRARTSGRGVVFYDRSPLTLIAVWSSGWRWRGTV